jgi:anti-sigma B factor antagonist
MSEHFEIVPANQVRIIKVMGNLINKSWMDELLDETDTCIQEGTANFVVDLDDVELINSSGISMLVNILTKARRSGGDVILCNISDKVARLMLITKLNSIFQITKDVQQAKNHFEAN